MKGIDIKNPPKPRYCVIWDVEIVLKCLKDLPSDESSPIQLLTKKTAMLLALTTVSRGSELQLLDTSLMARSESKLVFFFKERPKNCRGNKSPKPLEVFASGSELCPVKTTETYLKRTQYENRDPQLFLSVVAPHKGVSRPTIANWIKDILKMSGVDTDKFKAHSSRAAATSGARDRGASIEEILQRGQWSSKSTWQRFYNKKVSSKSENFQRTLLSGPS